MPVDQAQARLGDAGLVVRMAQGQYSTKIAADHVLRAQPPEGTTLEKGDRVTLVPSLGPRPVPVPDVIGKTLPKARDLLRDPGLQVGKVRKEYNERVDEGLVISQSVGGEAEAPIGSQIDLVISKGPTPVPVPKVVGLEQSDATAALQAEGFVVSVSEEFSERVGKGVVISQTPARGTDYQPGNSVSIVVSKGPPEFAMPSVVGMSRDEAVDKLRGLELLVDVSIVPGHPGARVVFQEPAAGVIVRAGDLVHIYVA
jgi:serine/threonine-protein kinase